MYAVGDRRRLYPGSEPRARASMTSHETVCVLNAGERDAHVEITRVHGSRSHRAVSAIPPRSRGRRTTRASSIGCPDRRSAHAPGFATSGERTHHHRRLPRHGLRET
jgi:hypothetical protein